MINKTILNKKPKQGYGFVYRYFYEPEPNSDYVGSTEYSLKERAGKYGKEYDKCPGISDLIHRVGYINLTVEILGEYPIAELEQKERYWQEHFNAVEIGYNQKYSSEHKKITVRYGETYYPNNTMSKYIKSDDSTAIFDSFIYEELFANDKREIGPTNRKDYYDSPKSRMKGYAPLTLNSEDGNHTVLQRIAEYVLGYYKVGIVRFGSLLNRVCTLDNIVISGTNKTLLDVWKENGYKPAVKLNTVANKVKSTYIQTSLF